MPRRIMWALLLTLVLIVGARLIIQKLILQAIQSHNVAFESSSTGMNHLSFQKLTRADLSIDHARIQLFPPLVLLDGAQLEVNPLQTTLPIPSSENTSPLQEWPSWLPIHIQNLRLQLPSLSESFALEGQLYPQFHLKGPRLWIQKTDAHFDIGLSQPLFLSHITAHLELQGQYQPSLQELDFKGQILDVRIEHPFLSTQPLKMAEAQFEGRLHKKELSMTVSAGQSQLQLGGEIHREDRPFSLTELSLHFSDLADWWSLTERRKCNFSGALTARGELSWPALDWRLELQESTLQSECHLFDPSSFQQGVFSYMPLSRQQLYETGPSTPHWSQNTGWLSAAACAAEDSQFFSHSGIDLQSIQSALDDHQSEKSTLRGGSTITQQLAKNLFTGNERTLHRKLRELIYTLELERTLSKDDILRIYLNIVEFGPDIYGIKAASESYFVKSPAQLLPEEAAYLAALLPSPQSGYQDAQHKRFRPFQVKRILTNMKDMGVLSEKELEAALRRRLLVVPPK